MGPRSTKILSFIRQCAPSERPKQSISLQQSERRACFAPTGCSWPRRCWCWWAWRRAPRRAPSTRSSATRCTTSSSSEVRAQRHARDGPLHHDTTGPGGEEREVPLRYSAPHVSRARLCTTCMSHNKFGQKDIWLQGNEDSSH